jgi:hypothetical protein
MIEGRSSWKRAGGFWVAVGVLLIIGVLNVAHWVECWRCQKQMAEQMTRSEQFTRVGVELLARGQLVTRAELVQQCIAQHGLWTDKQRVQEVCEQHPESVLHPPQLFHTISIPLAPDQ